jgi:hypothetical protein
MSLLEAISMSGTMNTAHGEDAGPERTVTITSRNTTKDPPFRGLGIADGKAGILLTALDHIIGITRHIEIAIWGPEVRNDVCQGARRTMCKTWTPGPGAVSLVHGISNS